MIQASLKMTASLLVMAIIICPAMSSPVVSTPKGTFQGTTLTSRKGKPYDAFRGIPFAKPPVGDLRFRPPVPADPIEGVYDATEYKPFCIQISVIPYDFGTGQEDCLYLNVFTPPGNANNKGELKKVLFFIHGGGNLNGFPDFYGAGNAVTEHDIILVVPAYRLGYLGFLSFMTPNCEGNFGLKDQLLALEWLKENIQSFGGDPDDITIGGVSAGGIDSTLLAFMPQSKDLFTKVYAQSGVTGVQHSILMKDTRPMAIGVARQFGCYGENQSDPDTVEELDQMVECLRKLPALSFYINEPGPFPPLGPVLGGDLFPKDLSELITDEEYLKSIKFFDRSYMVGINENEGAVFEVINDQLQKYMTEEQRQATPPQAMYYGLVQQFSTSAFGPISQTVIQRIAEYYNNNVIVTPLSDFTADAIFTYPSFQFVEAASGGKSSQDSKVYLFRFVHQPDFVTGTYRGMLHGVDMMYFFEADMVMANKMLPVQLDGSKWSEEDDLLARMYSTMVTDFMKTGDPSKSIPGGFPAYDSKEQNYLQFGLKSEVKQHFLSERVRIWSELIPSWIKEFPIEQEKKDEL